MSTRISGFSGGGGAGTPGPPGPPGPSGASGQIAQTYWVSSDGDNTTADGSIGLPYATLQAAHNQALVDYPLAGSNTVYVQITVGHGVYLGDTTITRQRSIINGAAGIAQTVGVTLRGQTTVDTSTSLSKFIDPYSFQGLRFQRTGSVAAPAFSVIGSGPASVFADSCYFESAGVGAGSHALYVSSTAAGNVRVELQNCLTLQSGNVGIAGVMLAAGAELRLNNCQIQATGSASGYALHVQNNSTVLAGRTLFDSNAALATISLDTTTGTIPANLNTCQVVNTNAGTSAAGITLGATTTNLTLVTSFLTWAVGSATTTATSRNVSVPTVESGTTTSLSTTTTVIDAAKTWTVNQHAGRVVQLTSGTFTGQARTIVSNTATVLTVTPAFGGVPALGVTYKIVPLLTWYRASDVFQLTTAYSSAVTVVALSTAPVGAV